MPYSALPIEDPAAVIRPVRYQVYGERCSGTHFVIKLLERNITSADFTEEFGFKHWFGPGAKAFPQDVAVVIVAREPFSWAQSFHEKPWHAAPHLREMSFSEFIRAEWVGGDLDDGGNFTEYDREREPITNHRFEDIWALREAKLTQWSALSPKQPKLLVDYERAARKPETFLNNVAAQFGWERKEPFAPIETYKGLGEEEFEPRSYPPISDEDRRFIKSRLNPLLEAKWFGTHPAS
jgi:hypothetical protein